MPFGAAEPKASRFDVSDANLSAPIFVANPQLLCVVEILHSPPVGFFAALATFTMKLVEMEVICRCLPEFARPFARQK